MFSRLHIFTSVWAVTCFTGFSSINCSTVTFYESSNFIGLLTELTPKNDTCVNLPIRAYDKSSSLTTKSCIILYTGENCAGTSIKVLRGNYPDLSKVSHAFNQHFGKAVRSFRQCNQELGSEDAVHASFYVGNDLVAEYKHICDCVTLPSLTDSTTRLDNHGTCIRLHLTAIGETPSCSEEYTTLQGGISFLSEHIRNLTHTPNSWKRIAAISPCTEVSTKCYKLFTTVTKFEVVSDPEKISLLASSSDVSLSITTTFRNNGSALVSQQYSATKTVTEATETTLVKNYSSIFNWSVETSVTTEFSADIPMVAKTSVTASLKSAYTGIISSSEEERFQAKKETTTEFSVSEKIEIGPCTMYKVNSFLKMIQNFPINYKLYGKVSGTVGERKLTAREIKSKLVGMEWVEDYDDHTIVVTGSGTMMMNYGVETVIDGEGEPIPCCQRKVKLSLAEESIAESEHDYSVPHGQ